MHLGSSRRSFQIDPEKASAYACLPWWTSRLRCVLTHVVTPSPRAHRLQAASRPGQHAADSTDVRGEEMANQPIHVEPQDPAQQNTVIADGPVDQAEAPHGFPTDRSLVICSWNN